MSILIAGCGYVGMALAETLTQGGVHVVGLRRSKPLGDFNFDFICADLNQRASLESLPNDIDCVVYAASADSYTEDAYRKAYVTGLQNLIDILHLRQANLCRFIFVSSTGVYSQKHGEWVDEKTDPNSQSFSGRCLFEGETRIRESQFPYTIVRFGGIYGPGRDRLVRQVLSGETVYPENVDLYTNRIHRDDCAGVLSHILNCPQSAELYLGVDDLPATKQEVYTWLASQTNTSPPSTVVWTERDIAKKGQGKRCSNKRLKAAGYDFRFPTFREGYRSILEPAS